MINLNNVTLLSVACIRVNESLNAIKKSKIGINFSKSKLFTSEDIVDSDVEIVKIKNLNYEEYNKFIVYELYKHIDTDYVLIVQDDGYVINPNMWRNEFFDYDYIGAPWSIPDPSDKISCRDPFGNIIRVGNGGFSFRSKKLLSIADQIGLEWKPFYGYYNEDGFYSVHNRHIYESHGCKYADVDVAKYFSHESQTPEIDGIIPFGFHGKWTKYYTNQ